MLDKVLPVKSMPVVQEIRPVGAMPLTKRCIFVSHSFQTAGLLWMSPGGTGGKVAISIYLLLGEWCS